MVVKMQEALMSIGVKKGLPYTKFLNRELSKLRGSGVLQNILTYPKLTCPLDEELIPITFSKIILTEYYLLSFSRYKSHVQKLIRSYSKTSDRFFYL